jgi:eukaryotic-like serine/threonine-protein kinase
MREPENMPGTVLGGRYELTQVRGAAALSVSGSVLFDATDLSSEEVVSVRLSPLERLIDPALGSTTISDAQALYEQQADTASSLRHPCIESVLDHGETTIDGERYVYMVAERLAGGSLREFLDRGRRLTPSQALIVGIDVCRALDAAAKQGITHGDLRPTRLVFGLDKRVRVVGFGSQARPFESIGLEQALYGAPELAEGGARGASSDVYSLALILVEAMTGEVPFAAETVAAAFTNRAGKLLPVSADFGALAQVLERAGRSDAGERFSPREMGQALVQAAEKMARPTPIDIVGGGLFDTDLASEPTQPAARPDFSQVEPVQNVAPDGPILIRTTPHIEAPTGPTPISIIDPTDPSLAPLTIGGDETGPIAVDVETLQQLAAQDPTAQVQVPKKKKWRKRALIAFIAVVLLVGASAAAYMTVLNPKNPVPALVGLAEAEARNQIAKFGWGITIVKERSDDVDTGAVIRTDPVMGANVAKRDTITLVISEGRTLSVLEDVTGLVAADALTKIEALGLVGQQADIADETIAAGIVISWSIPDQPTLTTGDSVVKGTTVTVNVSSGPEPRVVPDLAGKTLEEATAELTALGLVVAQAPSVPHPDIAAGKISVQLPVAGESLARGETVTVTVSAGQRTTLVPSIYGKNFDVVKERLERYGMVIGTVTGNKSRGLVSASIDGRVVRDFDRVVIGKTVELKFP